MTDQASDTQPVQLFPLRFDGEPVTDPQFALPVPTNFRPWEQVVTAYLATWTKDLRHAA